MTPPCAGPSAGPQPSASSSPSPTATGASRLAIRDGIVTDAFAVLAFADRRTPDQEAELTRLKADLAERVMALPADAVFDLD